MRLEKRADCPFVVVGLVVVDDDSLACFIGHPHARWGTPHNAFARQIALTERDALNAPAMAASLGYIRKLGGIFPEVAIIGRLPSGPYTRPNTAFESDDNEVITVRYSGQPGPGVSGTSGVPTTVPYCWYVTMKGDERKAITL